MHIVGISSYINPKCNFPVQSCCLKFNRNDGAELSVSFDNSIGSSPNLFRVSIAFFRSKLDSKPVTEVHGLSDIEFHEVLGLFLHNVGCVNPTDNPLLSKYREW